MDEEMLKKRMMTFERKRARLGLRAALPDDKRRRVWREPLTKPELHILDFMRSHGVITAKDLAGALDEELERRDASVAEFDRQKLRQGSQ